MSADEEAIVDRLRHTPPDPTRRCMTRAEYIGDQLRRSWLRQVRATQVLPWDQLTQCDQRKWVGLATVALEANACYRPHP
jgi:hypothetical protein